MTFKRYCIIDGSPFDTDDPDQMLCPHCLAKREKLTGEPTIAENQVNHKSELIRVNGVVYHRVTFGEEPEWGIPDFDLADYNLPQCPECGVGQGEIHGDMCAHEICPYCSHTLISCDCFNADQRNLSQDYLPPLPEISELDQTALDHLDETQEVTLDEKERKNQKEKYPCEWKPGQTIVDDYEIRQKIGQGGFCKVYQVHSNQTRQDYGVKCPYKGQEDLWRVEQEVAALFRLQGQPNILQIHRAHLWQGIPLIFMEYVEGGNLSNLINGNDADLYAGSQEEILQRILGIALQTARALTHVHAKQIVHLDIKSKAILLHPDGMVKLGGFGLAKILKEGEHSVPCEAYTQAYCSPEQAQRSNLTYKSDIWSWALVVLEMFNEGVAWLSGEVGQLALETYLKDQEDFQTPAMPEQLIVLLRKCFKEDPFDRPEDMNFILRFLQAIYQEIFGESYTFPGFSQPFSALEWMKEGIWQFELGNYAGAERLFQQVCTYYPENGWGWLNLMFALLNQSKDPAEAVAASTNPSHYEDHPGISIGQIALQLTTIDEIRIDQVNQVVWIHGGNGDIPMGVSYFAPNSYQGRNLSKFMLGKTFPQMKWRYWRIRNNIFWEAKLGSQENETLATIPSSATVAFEDKFSIKCIQCGKDITQFANSDGRAKELFGLVKYMCPGCVSEQLALTLEGFGDYRLIKARGWQNNEQLNRLIKLASGREMEQWCHAWHSKTYRMVSLLVDPEHLRKEFQNKIIKGQIPPLQTLHHPKLILPVECFEFAGKVYEVYEKDQGQPLYEYVTDQGGKLPLDQSIVIIEQIMDGVDYLHQKGLVHRDICTRNIRIKVDQGLVNARLSEWKFLGNAQSRIDLDAEATGILFGTYLIMAPEKILDSRTANQPTVDTYALGAVLYFMLTGCYPQPFPCQKEQNNEFSRDPIKIILDDDPIPIQTRLPDLPNPIAGVVDKAVRKDPKERYQTVRSFRQALIDAEYTLLPEMPTLVDEIPGAGSKTVFDNQFSMQCPEITCAICSKEITQFANSDGRAVEFLDDVIYWCSDCAWRQFPFQAYRSNDMGFVEYQDLGGGFALSHIGHHTVTGRVAVIRQVYFWRDQEESAENLLADYAQLTRIVHPNCTRIIQTATSGRGVLVASAYLQEATFTEMVSNNSGGMLTCQAAVIVGLKLLDGLEQIHTLGYTHANLHPGNILFKDGDFSKPKICLADFSPNYVYSFGCYDPERDSPIVNSASLPFLVPELILGTSQRDPAWDLYSLGQVLYFLLTGTVSHEVPKNLNPRDWNGLYEVLLENEPLSIQERKPTIPTLLADLIDRAVKKRPQERFNSLAEFRHALQEVLEE